MLLLGVAGCASNVGKTTVACRVLESLTGWGALKTSHGRSGAPPGDIDLVVDRDRLDATGSDTALYGEAGAARVVWLRCPRERLADALPGALRRFRGLPGVVVEGNSWTRHAPPGYLIVVARPGVAEIKPSARSLPRVPDELVWNVPDLQDFSGRLGETREHETVFRPRHVTVIDAAVRDDPGLVAVLNRVRIWARR